MRLGGDQGDQESATGCLMRLGGDQEAERDMQGSIWHGGRARCHVCRVQQAEPMRHLLSENGIETEDMRYFVAMRQQVKRQKGIKGTRVSTWMASVKSH